MKPSLTILDPKGHHNLNMPKSIDRLIKGSSWKRTRVVMVIPANDIPGKVMLSYWGLIFPPNQPVVKILAQGLEVGEAYSAAVEQIISHPELRAWEYLLTLEHDNMPPNDGLIKLIARMEKHREFSCIGGLYFTKGEGGVAQIWGDPTDPVLNYRPQVPRPGEVVECCGTGMGFNVYRLQMFRDERLRKPWFKTVADKTGTGTQDLYFWSDARKFGYRCAVDCDVLVGHYDKDNDIVW